MPLSHLELDPDQRLSVHLSSAHRGNSTAKLASDRLEECIKHRTFKILLLLVLLHWRCYCYLTSNCVCMCVFNN